MLAFLEQLNGGETVAVMGILAGAVVLALTILVTGWTSANPAAQVNALKRDMLARGLSVQEIEQLTMPEPARQAQAAREHSIRQAQIDADLKRDLVARGMPIEQMAHAIASASDIDVLADTLCAMGEAGNLDRKAVANLLGAFLKRGDAVTNGARKG